MTSEKEPVDVVSDFDDEGNGDSIEERVFSAALICLEGHFTQSPPMGPKTAAKVSAMIAKTLEKTHTLRKVRYVEAHTHLFPVRHVADRIQRDAVAQRGDLDLAHTYPRRLDPNAHCSLCWALVES